MTPHRIAAQALSFLLVTTGLSIAGASSLAQDAPRLAAYAQDRDRWDAPPQDLQDIQLKGFRDGIQGARKDFEKHREADVNNREEYRDPKLPTQKREAYRDGFRLGYERGVSHEVGGPQEPVGRTEQPASQPRRQMFESNNQMREPDHGFTFMDPGVAMGQDRGMGEGMGSDVQRRGFQEGMEGARKDMDNHRHPNVNNRDEYRHPSVPRDMRNEYREAFRRGYDRGMSQMMGGREHDHDHDQDHDRR